MDTWAEAMSPSIMGIRKGVTRRGPRSLSTSYCWERVRDAADAAADDGADAEGVFGGQVEAGLATGFLGGDGGELGEAVHAPAFLALQVVLRVKAFHLGGEGGIEPFGVKGGDVVDAGIALDDAGPG